jgi:hypothetical protein
MAITLTIRNRCVRPVGTMNRNQQPSAMHGPRRVPTMSVVVEVGELIAPLSNYAERVLNEGNDDQEASHCGQIPVRRPSVLVCRPSCRARALTARCEYSRLHRVRNRVQPVFYLVRLLP